MVVVWFSAGKMFSPFEQIKNYLKVDHNKVATENWLFKLQTKLSLVLVYLGLLILMSPCVILRDMPLDCFGPDPKIIPLEFLDAYCFLHGTYIVPEAINLRVGIDIPFPGIAPDGPSTTRLYQFRYIFYPFMLALQIFFIRGSRRVWKFLEGGRLKYLISELKIQIAKVDEEKLKKRIDIVTTYMSSNMTFRNSYAYRYVFCELLIMANLVFQFWLVNSLLDNEYLEFGWKGVRYISSLSKEPSWNDHDKEIVENPFIRLFPKMTICKIDVAGSSGNVVIHEALCVMTLNNIAEKVFFAMWFWFMFLAIVSTFGLIYRCSVLFSKRARYMELCLKVDKSVCTREELKNLVDKYSYGDWFVLSLIQKNTDVWVFPQLLEELLRKMFGKRRKDM
ncbi:unnamed protein product [Orchesella dallaii]|uniref:Innexin n=1 Tax=Orchesella dallaii TaxID=48710 RepID=A0ABP1S860_9HEXA